MNRCGFRRAACIKRRIDVLVRASTQCQRNLDILDIVLIEEKCLSLSLSIESQRRTAAAEITYLHVLVNRGTAFCKNTAISGDIAPDIQFAAICNCDLCGILHFDIPIRAGRCAAAIITACAYIAVSIMLCTDTNCTVHSNRTAFRHGKRSICGGCRPSCYRVFRGICIARPCLIERNQKCNSSRNGVAAADRAIRSQRNLGLAVCPCVSNRFIQVCKPLTASLKKRQRLAHKLRRNGAVTFDI